jgi:predicted nucleic acid-binding protein
MAFLASAPARSLFLSVFTLGELWKGVEARRRTDGHAADRLGAWVEGIESQFAERIVPIDTATAGIWRELLAAQTLPVIDTLIAASAIRHGLVLVTRNVRDVGRTGVTVLDPWGTR